MLGAGDAALGAAVPLAHLNVAAVPLAHLNVPPADAAALDGNGEDTLYKDGKNEKLDKFGKMRRLRSRTV